MPRLIKRYENRKLYDTVARRYISLEEIAELIRSGEDITVADNASGGDITTETLAKVVVEEHTAQRGTLPPQYLHDLLRSGGRMVTRNFDLLLEASLKRLPGVRETREEMSRLRERLDKLEKVIDRMDREGSHGKPK